MEDDKAEIYKAIYEVVRLIPKGRVTSYGAVAKAMGLKSARIVGRAMAMTTDEKPPVPYHRVVSSSGVLLSDHGKREKELLNEGIVVRNNKIVDFKNKFWNPLKDINI